MEWITVKQSGGEGNTEGEKWNGGSPVDCVAGQVAQDERSRTKVDSEQQDGAEP